MSNPAFAALPPDQRAALIGVVLSDELSNA
jgi:hypothetical protein